MVCLALCYHVTLPVEKCPDAACHLQIFLILGGSFVSIFGKHPEIRIHLKRKHDQNTKVRRVQKIIEYDIKKHESERYITTTKGMPHGKQYDI